MWDYLAAAAAPVLPLGAVVSVSELRVDYPNGGQVRLYGADNPDALRGIYLDGVVLDEYADMHPRLYPEVIRPALADRGGWAVFIGTPKGHNDFHRIHEQAQRDPGWFSLVLKASQTGILRPAELAAAESELTKDQFAQEFECSFEAAIRGAYFAHEMSKARDQGRIRQLREDPLLPLWAFVDIGGSGATADAFVIWIAQFVGQEIWLLDYYESIGQTLATHVNWLRQKGYQRAIVRLPHDGVNANNITGKQYVDHFRDAGFDCPPPVPNQGKGATSMRVEAARRLLPRCQFNEATTGGGREALIYYHEKRDEKRNIGLGPDHDWSSHCADALGLMCICYEEPSRTKSFNRALNLPKVGYA